MKNLAVLVVAVIVAVFATAAVTGNAGVNKAAREHIQVATLQKQINELRSELICDETATGNGLSAVWWQGHSTAASETPVNDRGVCKKLGVTTVPTTTQNGSLTPPFNQLVRRAFGG